MTRSAWTSSLALPAIAFLLVFCLLPAGLVVSYSFFQRDFHGEVLRQLSWDGWQQAADSITLRILGRSAALALIVTVVDLSLAYPCAISLAALAPRRRQALVVLISFPLITSLLLRIYGWMNVLPLEWRATFSAVALVMAINYLPFMLLPLLRAFERADISLTSAALDLGATPWQAFWRVTWHITSPGMWAGCALVFIPVCGEYLVPHFLGEGKVTVIGTTIVQEFMERRNWPYAAACGVWLMAVVLIPVVVSLLHGWRYTVEQPASPKYERR